MLFFVRWQIGTVNPAGFVGSFVVRAATSTLRDFIVAIKSQTDEVIFTCDGTDVDANIQSINDVTITGDGNTDDKFDVV